MRKRILFCSTVIATLAVLAVWLPQAQAVSNYFATDCASCHAAPTPSTCNGCHAHGVHASSAKTGINIAGATDKASYAPGEQVSVSISGGYRNGWVRAILYDQNMQELSRSTGSATGGMGGGAGLPVTLSAPAPATPGTYTWNVAWYGNQRETAAGAFGSRWVADANNSGHGQEIVATNSFTVAAPAPTPTPTPAACTSFTYSEWGACVNNSQARQVVSSVPAGCTGGTPEPTTQACTATPPPSPVCTSFTYSEWGTCVNNSQTRQVVSSVPAGCTGGTPEPTTQACTQTQTPTPTPTPEPTPAPAADKMPVPGGKQTFYFAPVETPVLNGDPAKAKPIGVGPIADGGETLEIKLALDEFAAPVDVSFGIYALAIDPVDVFFLDNGRNLNPLSKKLLEAALELKIARPADARGEEDDDDEEDDDNVKKEAQKRMVWKASVASLNENIFGAIPVSALPEGLYMLMVKVSPAGKQHAHYLWMTSFVVQ